MNSYVIKIDCTSEDPHFYQVKKGCIKQAKKEAEGFAAQYPGVQISIFKRIAICQTPTVAEWDNEAVLAELEKQEAKDSVTEFPL